MPAEELRKAGETTGVEDRVKQVLDDLGTAVDQGKAVFAAHVQPAVSRVLEAQRGARQQEYDERTRRLKERIERGRGVAQLREREAS